MRWKLRGSRPLAAGTIEWTFEPDGPFSYEAGQNVDYTLPELTVPDDGKGRVRTFSLVRAPGVGIPTVATRTTGSAFKRTVAELPIGSVLSVDGPNGTFTLPRESRRPVVLHAGGIGITPFFSMVEDATLRNLPHRIVLVYSNRAPSTAAYLGELKGFEGQNPNFRLVPTMTNLAGETWGGPHGPVSTAFFAEHVPELPDAVHYVAGPPGLVAAMRTILQDAGVEDAFIKTEEFTGY